MPSLTNIGSTRSAGASRVCAAAAAAPASPQPPPPGEARGFPRPAAPLLAAPSSDSAAAARAYSASASTSAPTAAVSGCTSTRSPNSAALAAVCGPMPATTVRACGLPAMPTRLRTVEDDVKQHRVEAAGLDRVADRGGRRCRPHRPVGGDVVDLPAALAQPGGERLGRDVGPRQQHPVDRVEDLVVRREVRQQALGGLLAGRAPARA